MRLRNSFGREVSGKFWLTFLPNRNFHLGQRVMSPIKDDMGKEVDFAGSGYVAKIKVEARLTHIKVKHSWIEYVSPMGEIVGMDTRPHNTGELP